MSDLDAMIASIQAQSARRESELREAFSSQSSLDELIVRDASRLIAGVGGYAAPLDGKEREKWIAEHYCSDPFFRAQVQATANLIREYVDAARSLGTKTPLDEKEAR